MRKLFYTKEKKEMCREIAGIYQDMLEKLVGDKSADSNTDLAKKYEEIYHLYELVPKTPFIYLVKRDRLEECLAEARDLSKKQN